MVRRNYFSDVTSYGRVLFLLANNTCISILSAESHLLSRQAYVLIRGGLRYTLMQKYVFHAHIHTTRTPDENIQDLQAVFLSFSYIFLFRDKIDGSLRGMMLLGYNRSEEHTTIKIGISIFKNYYGGGPYAYLAMGYIFLRGEYSKQQIFVCS